MEQITRRSYMVVTALGGAAAMAAGRAQAAVAGSDAQSLASLARSKGLTGFGNAIGGVGIPGSAFSDLGARQIQIRACGDLDDGQLFGHAQVCAADGARSDDSDFDRFRHRTSLI